MELKGIILPPLAIPGTCKGVMQFEVENIFQLQKEYESLHDKTLTIKAKPYKPKRSLDANAYFWVLCREIASATRTTSIEIHDRYVFDYRIPYRDAEDEIEWQALPYDKDGSIIGDTENRKYFIQIGEGEAELKGKKCKMRYWLRIKGTSDMNSAELAQVIDDIVSEAKGLGIDTATPEEIERIKNLYG